MSCGTTNSDVLEDKAENYEKCDEYCTANNCINDKDMNRLKCTKCLRSVHYGCSQLPAYQIQTILDKCRHFHCISCVEVSKDLIAILNTTNSLNRSKDIDELTMSLRRVSIDNNKKLENNDRVRQRETNYRRTVMELNREIAQHKKKIKEFQKEEEKFKAIIAQCDKSDTSENIENIVEKVEDIVEKKMEKLSKSVMKSFADSLKETLISEAKKNRELVEDKIEQFVEVSNTYAQAAQNGLPANKENKKILEKELQKVIRDVKNDDLAEEKERNRRACNFIIHGVVEERKRDKTQQQYDEELIKRLLRTVHDESALKWHTRIGEAHTEKNRPIKVHLRSESDKKKVMSNLTKLKGKEVYNGLSVKSDYTTNERELIRDYVTKARDLNSKENEDSRFIWRVRGEPKNGLCVKRLIKKK